MPAIKSPATALSSTTSVRRGDRPSWLAGNAAIKASDTGAFSTKENVLPLPNSLLSSITPPIIWIRRWLMAKPRPVPPNFRVVEASACVKSVNISA